MVTQVVGWSLFTFINLLGDHLTTDHLFSSPTLAKLRYQFTRGPPRPSQYLKAQTGRPLTACSRRVAPVLRRQRCPAPYGYHLPPCDAPWANCARLVAVSSLPRRADVCGTAGNCHSRNRLLCFLCRLACPLCGQRSTQSPSDSCGERGRFGRASPARRREPGWRNRI